LISIKTGQNSNLFVSRAFCHAILS
jgi:hypothetical protein